MLIKSQGHAFSSIWDTIKHRFPTFLALCALGLCFSLSLASCQQIKSIDGAAALVNNKESATSKLVRIGYQPFGTPPLLKARGTLEKRLQPLGINVEWMSFPAGPPILKAMKEGKVDIGFVGGIPTAFAQAEEQPFVYVANAEPNAQSIGILVPENSPIRNFADLKGKKIAFTKKSAAHYLLIQALLKANLTLDSVQQVYLTPPEGQAAFEQKQVDAWVVWNPFLAQIQTKMPVRILADGGGLTQNLNFYVATSDFANNNANTVKIVIQEMQQAGIWGSQNLDEVARMIAKSAKLELATMQKVNESATYGVQAIQDRAIEEQQRTAETFFRLGLLPQRIWVEDAVWKEELID
ncbi:MAG: sulfonate ABC transporter substrate-binding protein [Microcoleus sp.]